MSVVLSSTIMLVDLFVAFMQVKVSAANMWVTIFLKLCTWESLLQSCWWYFLQCIMHMTISIVIMQVTVSVEAMYVTVLCSNFIFFYLTDTHFS